MKKNQYQCGAVITLVRYKKLWYITFPITALLELLFSWRYCLLQQHPSWDDFDAEAAHSTVTELWWKPESKQAI